MAPIPREEFARLVRGLSPPAFARFVADLWRARGREVSVDGAVVVATDPDGGATERLLVHHDPGWLRRRPLDLPRDGRIDRVVTSGRGAPAGLGRVGRDVEVVDVDDLRLIALYAVDRDRADDVFRTYVDRSLAVDDPGPPGIVRGVARASPRAVYAAVGALVALLLVVGALGGGAAFAPVVGGDGAPEPATPGSTVTPLPVTTAGGTAPGGSPGASTGRSAADDRFPPGLDEGGITDYTALAAAHARAISGQSYRLEIRYYEIVDRELEAVVREDVRVESPTVYAAEVRSTGTTRYDPLVIADWSTYSYGFDPDEVSGVVDGDVYADGATRYERRIEDGTARYDRGPVFGDYRRGRQDSYIDRVERREDRYADRVERYLGWFLSVEESRITATQIRDGERYFWVMWTGDPYPGIRNTTGVALVDSSGIVHQARRGYRVPGSDRVSVVATIEYEAIGNTTVDPPAWLPEARNATGGAPTG